MPNHRLYTSIRPQQGQRTPGRRKRASPAANQGPRKRAPRKNLWVGTLSFTGLKFSKLRCISTKALPWKVATRLEIDFLRHELLRPMGFERQARQVATRRCGNGLRNPRKSTHRFFRGPKRIKTTPTGRGGAPKGILSAAARMARLSDWHGPTETIGGTGTAGQTRPSSRCRTVESGQNHRRAIAFLSAPGPKPYWHGAKA